MQCQAKAKRTGEQCQRRAVVGMRVCQVHGGGTPKGAASPHYKGGRYSKYLPARLLERYHEAQDDAMLLELRSEIALLDARLTDVLGRVDTGEAGALWQQLRAALVSFDNAQQKGDTNDMKAHLFTMRRLINQGVADYAAWEDVRSLLEQRRRLVESERKRLVEMRQMMTAEQAMLFVMQLREIVLRYVDDPDKRRAISDDLIRLTVQQPRGLVE